MKRIYLDHASTSPMLPQVADKMYKVMQEDFGNPSSIHYFGRSTRALIEDSRKVVANYIKSSIGEIFFTSSATEANNTILKNCVQYHGVKRIISSPTEHHCVLHTLDYLEEHGTDVVYLDVDTKGNIDVKQIEQLLEDDTKTLVSVMYGNNEIGTIHPIKEISALCQSKNVLFHCDAVQAMTKIDINVGETYFSFLTASAHKFNGPKGVGFFYMNGDNIIPPFIHGGAQERNMRAGTENTYGIVGLAEALNYHTKEKMEENNAKMYELRDYFINRLTTELKDIRINGNADGNQLPHVISASFPPSEKQPLLMFNLDISGIATSAGSACSSGIENDSHVLEAIKHPTDRKTIRFSISHLNTKEEIDYCMEKLKGITPTI